MSEEQRRFGRAKNAMLDYLEQHLSIPEIYIDAEWNGHRVDVLAINRDGVGDVHAVLLFPNRCSGVATAFDELSKAILPIIEPLQHIPAQYQYIGSVDIEPRGQSLLSGLQSPLLDQLIPEDGFGRIGILEIDFSYNGEPRTTTVLKPERFRAKIAKLATEYVQVHEPDWEICA
jgi:hypothetical protein